jgi:hypothetical protein
MFDDKRARLDRILDQGWEERMGRKTPTNWSRQVMLVSLWTIALYACLLVGLSFATSRGCETWRNWNASVSLPKGGPLMVQRLEEYKARYGYYPAALPEVGPVDGLPEEGRVMYRLVEDSNSQEFVLSIGVYPSCGCEFDNCWRYESRRGRWIYNSIYQSGG